MFEFITNVIVQAQAVFVGVLVFVVVYTYMRPKKNYPPGPLSLPFVGTLFSHALVQEPEEFTQLAQKYGHIYMLNVCSSSITVISSFEAIEAAAKSLHFADRKFGNEFTVMSMHKYRRGGIGMRDFDQTCRKSRQISLSIMRNLGMGRSAMEDIIKQEAEELCTGFELSSGKPFNPWHDVTSCVVNVILHVLLNQRHERNDKELEQLVKDLDDFMSEFRLFPIFDCFPFLRFIPPLKRHFDKLMISNAGLINYLWRHTKPLITDFHPGRGSNFVDAYLEKHFDSHQQKVSFDNEDFKLILRDMIIGGTETLATSIKWTLLLLTNLPVIQRKLQEELDREVGKSRTYRIGDKIPYLDAVIWEVQRYSSLVPMALPHAVSLETDAELCGYDIPKCSLILFNLFAVHHDKAIWGDPENFRPERFLDDSGDFVKNPFVIPFSVGKRSCLGELFARQQLYIFTATLFQKFTFLHPEGVHKFDSKPGLSFTRVPKPFNIRAIPRN